MAPAEDGIQSLAGILGLRTKKSIYDDDAKLLICAEASNRIRFLEGGIMRCLESRFGGFESRPRWLSILREIGNRVAETLAMVKADNATKLRRSTRSTSPAAAVARREKPSGPARRSSCEPEAEVSRDCALNSPGLRGRHEGLSDDQWEAIERTAYPNCVKVMSNRFQNLSSPVAGRDRLHASPRVSPRVLPSPRANEPFRLSPFGFSTPQSRLSSPTSETSRTVKGRASRKLSFDGQTEGECAEAAGLCPSYTSPSVRRLRDLRSSQEDVRKPDDIFLPPKTIRRRRVQSLNAPFPTNFHQPGPVAPVLDDFDAKKDNPNSPLTPSTSLSHLSAFSTRRDPSTTSTPTSLLSPRDCDSPSLGSSSRCSTPSIRSPSILPCRLAPVVGLVSRVDEGAYGLRCRLPISASCSLPATPAHRTGGPSFVLPSEIFHDGQSACQHDVKNVDVNPSNPKISNVTSAQGRVFPSAFRPFENERESCQDAPDSSFVASRLSPASAFVPVSASAPCSAHKRNLPRLSVFGGPLVFGDASEKVIYRMGPLRGRQVLPSPNSKAIRRICFSSPTPSEPQDGANNFAPARPPLNVGRNGPMLPLVDSYVDEQSGTKIRSAEANAPVKEGSQFSLMPHKSSRSYDPGSMPLSLLKTCLHDSASPYNAKVVSRAATLSNATDTSTNAAVDLDIAAAPSEIAAGSEYHPIILDKLADKVSKEPLTEVDQFFVEFRRSLEEDASEEENLRP